MKIAFIKLILIITEPGRVSDNEDTLEIDNKKNKYMKK